MNAAKKPVVETFGHVRGFGRTRAPRSLYLSVTAGEGHESLSSHDVCNSLTLSALLGLIRSTAGTVRMCGVDRWADPVGTRRDFAALRLTVAPRAGSRRHGTVR